MNFDLSFLHNYDVELGGDLPSGIGAASLFRFPADKVSGGDGIFLKVSPTEPVLPWYGIFAFGHGGNLRGVFSCPDPDMFCVVSDGKVYLVDSSSARAPIEIQFSPLKQVVPVVAANLILFADFLKIWALGRKGIEWTTERLAWDDVKITGFDQTHVWGEGYDPTNSIQPKSTFKVELATGKVVECSTRVPL